MARPSFRTTKGERNAMTETIDTSDIEQWYRDVCGGRYVWDGLPEGCPRDFIESTALFYNEGVGARRVPGLYSDGLILPAKASTVSVYGTPVDWLPGFLPGITGYESVPSLYQPSDSPVLWMQASVISRIRPWLDIMSAAIKCLNSNVQALQTPVLISGRPSGCDGDNLTAVLLRDDLGNAAARIPVIDPNGLPVEVLDLGAQDHTQNLMSTIEACHSKILELIQSGDGVAKSSGITVQETVNGSQSVEQTADMGLDKRREWCDAVNDALGWSLSVRRPAQTMAQAPQTEEEGDEDEPDM